MQYSHSHPWEKSAQPPAQTDPHPSKNQKTKNKKTPEY
jgi:hypothetical protein